MLRHSVASMMCEVETLKLQPRRFSGVSGSWVSVCTKYRNWADFVTSPGVHPQVVGLIALRENNVAIEIKSMAECERHA